MTASHSSSLIPVNMLGELLDWLSASAPTDMLPPPPPIGDKDPLLLFLRVLMRVIKSSWVRVCPLSPSALSIDSSRLRSTEVMLYWEESLLSSSELFPDDVFDEVVDVVEEDGKELEEVLDEGKGLVEVPEEEEEEGG